MRFALAGRRSASSPVARRRIAAPCGCPRSFLFRRSAHPFRVSPSRAALMSTRRSSEYIYRPAWWVPGAHAQTLWGKLFRRPPRVQMRAERWETPDGDFVDVHRLDAPAAAPRLFLLHGLEGTARSHYVAGFFS